MESLRVADVGCHEATILEQDRRWRGNPNGGSTLQGGHRVHCPAEASGALGPVEAAGPAVSRALHGLVDLVDHEDVPWVTDPRGQDDHALASLGEPERAGVDDPVGPRVAPVPEPVRQEAHGPTPVQLEHEGNVLKQQPLGLVPLDEPQELGDETGATARNPGSLAGLAKVLAWEAAGHEIDLGKCLQVADIACQLDAREPRLEDFLSPVVDLTQQERLVTRGMQAQLDPADACEQSRNLHELTPLWRPRTYRGRTDAFTLPRLPVEAVGQKTRCTRRGGDPGSTDPGRPTVLLLSEFEC